jgi:hypothetical protein
MGREPERITNSKKDRQKQFLLHFPQLGIARIFFYYNTGIFPEEKENSREG